MFHGFDDHGRKVVLFAFESGSFQIMRGAKAASRVYPKHELETCIKTFRTLIGRKRPMRLRRGPTNLRRSAK